MARFRNALDQVVEDFFEGSLLPWAREGNGSPFLPPIDLRETDDALVAEVEIPGMNQKDISVQVVGNMLNIRGERKHEAEHKTKNYHRHEMSCGTFERQIDLPSEIDPDKVEATYTNGILQVTLPKVPGAKAKTVAVKVK
jgi:HSP20 family protein